MNRRRANSLAGSPLLIGAITTLIAIVAVFLSYNANNGLPFTPTYDIKVQLPEASGLQTGNQVRIGGTRVGVVSALAPYENPRTGRVTAIASLKLEKSAGPLPVDTRAIVQLVSTIGLKYLSLERGHSQWMLKGGQTIPVAQTREPVDIDQFFDMFDKKTRIANQVNLTTFGNGLAGRGTGINETIATLRPLVTNAIPVLRTLAAPRTGFGQLFVALDRAAKEVAPVANQQAALYSDLDTLFTAWASVAPSLEETIEGGPPALRQATRSLPFEAEFVNRSADFMRLLRPSASKLRTVAGPLGHAFAAGAVNIRTASTLGPEVAEASQAFAAFAKDPLVTGGIEDLTQTLALGNPVVAGLGSEQAGCNYVSLAFRNLASVLTESAGVGTLGRAIAVLAPRGPNNEGVPSSAPAASEKAQEAGRSLEANNLHVNPYPLASAPGQPHVCEAGNEKYQGGKPVIGNVPGASSAAHDKTERANNLYGEKYPRATLEALGLATPKPKKKTKKGKKK